MLIEVQMTLRTSLGDLILIHTTLLVEVEEFAIEKEIRRCEYLRTATSARLIVHVFINTTSIVEMKASSTTQSRVRLPYAGWCQMTRPTEAAKHKANTAKILEITLPTG
jgi:hypothetical protein